MYLAYALSVAYSPNFSLPIAFTCMVRQTFPIPNISHVPYNLFSSSGSTIQLYNSIFLITVTANRYIVISLTGTYSKQPILVKQIAIPIVKQLTM